jgi:hypothetical protein
MPAGAAHGLHACALRAFSCLQAISWPLHSAARLLRSPRVALWSEPHRGDLLVRDILAPGVYGVHIPNLVEHRGEQSLCNPGAPLSGLRVARNYPGPSFDALTLPYPQ